MRTTSGLIAGMVSAALLSACAATPATGKDHSAHGGAAIADAPTPPALMAPILGRSGAQIGQARLREGPAGVLIELSFQPGALPAGWHGAHLHQVGRCDDAAAGFQASGGHVGKRDGVAHGLLHPKGPEDGDLPSLFAPQGDQAWSAEMFSPFVTLSGVRGRAPIFDTDGTALIIHENRDDQVSQPIGGAGGRIACAAFTR